MRLTRYTDHALRVLMHLAVRPEQLSPISEIARTYQISPNHLMKVMHDLRKAGYVVAVRGRTGGFSLARPAVEIGVGEVVRHAESVFDLADCGSCVIAPACSLSGALAAAVGAFMRTLDSYTLEDLVEDQREVLRALVSRDKV